MNRDYRLANQIMLICKEASDRGLIADEKLHSTRVREVATKKTGVKPAELAKFNGPNHQTLPTGATKPDTEGRLMRRLGFGSDGLCECGHRRGQHINKEHKDLGHGGCQFCACGKFVQGKGKPNYPSSQKEASAHTRADRMAAALGDVMEKSAEAMHKEAGLLPWALATAAVPLGLFAANAIKRVSWGDKPNMMLTEEQQVPLLNATRNKQIGEQSAKMADYKNLWKPTAEGNFVNPESGEKVTGEELNKRLGVMSQNATANADSWLRHKLEGANKAGYFDTRYGTWVPGKLDLGLPANEMDVDYQDWLAQMRAPRSGFAKMFGSPFLHNGSIYFGEDNPYRQAFGHRNPYTGPGGLQNLRNYYRSGMEKTLTGGPLYS